MLISDFWFSQIWRLIWDAPGVEVGIGNASHVRLGELWSMGRNNRCRFPRHGNDRDEGVALRDLCEFVFDRIAISSAQ